MNSVDKIDNFELVFVLKLIFSLKIIIYLFFKNIVRVIPGQVGMELSPS